MQVNAEQCTGCGVCVESCPTGAIRLSDGLAVLDQATCNECQACAEACAVGAITAIQLPMAVKEPAAVQSVGEAETVFAPPIPSISKPWLGAVLAFAGREILPRLADSVIAALDRRLAQAQPAKQQVHLASRSAEVSPMLNSGRGYRRRIRCGRASLGERGQGRGRGGGVGKGKWS